MRFVLVYLWFVSAASLYAEELPAFMNPVAVAERERLATLIQLVRNNDVDEKEKDVAINAWIDRQLDLCRKHDNKQLRLEFATLAVGFAVDKKRYSDAVTLQKYMIDGAYPLEKRADHVASLGGILDLMAKEAESPEIADELRDQARAAFADSRREADAYADKSPAAFKRLVISILDEAALLRQSSAREHASEAAELYQKAREYLSEQAASRSEDKTFREALIELSALGITEYAITQREAVSRAKAHQLDESLLLLRSLLDQTRTTDSISAERQFARDVLLAAKRYDSMRPEEVVLPFMNSTAPGIAGLVIVSKTADRLYGEGRYETCVEVCSLVTKGDDQRSAYVDIAAQDPSGESLADVQKIAKLYALSLAKLNHDK